MCRVMLICSDLFESLIRKIFQVFNFSYKNRQFCLSPRLHKNIQHQHLKQENLISICLFLHGLHLFLEHSHREWSILYVSLIKVRLSTFELMFFFWVSDFQPRYFSQLTPAEENSKFKADQKVCGFSQ